MFKWLEKYFTFSKMERNGIVVLLTLSCMALLAPKVYFYFKPAKHADNSKYEAEIDAFAHSNSTLSTGEDTVDTVLSSHDSTRPKPDSIVIKRRHTTANYFEFDPNKIGAEEWMRLGFTEKQAQSIENYKAKGGKFYRPQDLMRLYVMDEEHYYKLKPYVKIDASALPKRNYDRY